MVAKTSTSEEQKRGTHGIVIKEKHGVHTYSAMQRDLISRLDHLRAEARETCESYLANLDAEIATLIDFLNGSSEVRTPEDRKAATLRTWTVTLDGLNVKPRKGRRKDLRRIDQTVKTMMKTAFE